VSVDITIDRQRCMGSANCQFWADGVFDLDDEGVATVIDANAAPVDKLVLAAQGCPTGAIAITDDGIRLD